MHLYMLSVLIASTALTAATADPLFRIGVCTHFSQGKGEIGANLDLIRAAGARFIRDEVTWRTLERSQGQLTMPAAYTEYVDKAVERGIEPMLILDYGNPFYDGGDKPLSADAMEGFTRYSEFVVSHFKGKVRHYEIWNEWDIGIGATTPGTAESYAHLLEKVYTRIKRIDPTITVYGGAMTPGGIRNGWLERMLKAGGLSSLDVLSIHTYNYSASGFERTPEAWAEWMHQVKALVAKHSGSRTIPIAVTEMGWPTQIDRRGTPPDISAAYLARMYLLARSIPGMNGLWWYDFQDDGWNSAYNEDNFGLVRPDLTPKPAYSALSAITHLVANATYEGRADVGESNVYVLRFRRPDGSFVLAMWSAHPDDDYQLTIRSERPNAEPVSIEKAGSQSVRRPWGSRAWTEDRSAAAQADELEITVRETPWLVSGDLAKATVAGVKKRNAPQSTRAVQFLQ